ncbi:RNA-dependent DNA polymerase, partial [Candidatus Parcubacteria bacterium]|nr:RNA-dependent DNA polymerase [Candidatus Parcubacteria bacterium]
MRVYTRLFNKITDTENLFSAWDEFKCGKRNRPDVLAFEENIEQNIFALHRDLISKKYKHGAYSSFYIYDPKLRHIHKATVRDRVLHHAIFKILNPIFEPTFISHSFSCRVGKGTHKGVEVLDKMLRKVSRNYSQTAYALKCDVRKFFDSVDHAILIQLLRRKIKDADTLWLMEEIIESFTGKSSDLFTRKGLPIGNLTSQLFANVYMNEFDQFMKKELKIGNYVRYTDDFIAVSESEDFLKKLIPKIQDFLRNNLNLELHPSKVTIGKYRRGVDFLGYVSFPHYRSLRKRTERRMIRKLDEKIEMVKKGQITDESLR